MAMILVSGNSRRRSWIVSMPSFSGMKMSVTITVAGRARCSSRPCAPFAAPSASMPWIWNHSRESFLKSSLSSMTRTRVICGVAENPTRDSSGVRMPCGNGIAKGWHSARDATIAVWGFSGHGRLHSGVVHTATACHIQVTTAPAASPVCSPRFATTCPALEREAKEPHEPACRCPRIARRHPGRRDDDDPHRAHAVEARRRQGAAALSRGGRLRQGGRSVQRPRRAERDDGRRALATVAGGGQGRQAEEARGAAQRARFLGRLGRADQLAHRRPGAPQQRGGARDRRGGAGRPLEVDGARARRPAARRRVPAYGEDNQQEGGAAREVGTEGKLGGQAKVKGVAGTWKDLTDSVNSMAGNLTAQVRNIADVTTAVARGDLSRKITVDVKGEILELKNTINTMVDQLSS